MEGQLGVGSGAGAQSAAPPAHSPPCPPHKALPKTPDGCWDPAALQGADSKGFLNKSWEMATLMALSEHFLLLGYGGDVGTAGLGQRGEGNICCVSPSCHSVQLPAITGWLLNVTGVVLWHFGG